MFTATQPTYLYTFKMWWIIDMFNSELLINYNSNLNKYLSFHIMR